MIAKPTATKPRKKPAGPSVTLAKSGVKTTAVKTTTTQVPRQKPTPAPLKPTAELAQAKVIKDKKVKVVRDSFTLPKTELLQITEMKKRAMALGVEVKKSELIRAGLKALAGMGDTAFKKAMSSVPTIKTGRPAKD